VSKIAFELLVREGTSCHEFPVRLIWKSMRLPSASPAQVAFSVPRRNFRRAVDRNRVKRLMREVYRKNKGELYALLKERNEQYAFLFVYTGKSLPSYEDVRIKITLTLQRFAETFKKPARKV
jgi:ribonuclease P protein component